MNKELEHIYSDFESRENPFSSLLSFFAGYESGFAAAKYGHAKPEDLIPHEFHKFVSEKLGKRFPNAKGWKILIKENASSEKDAFDLFV